MSLAAPRPRSAQITERDFVELADSRHDDRDVGRVTTRRANHQGIRRAIAMMASRHDSKYYGNRRPRWLSKLPLIISSAVHKWQMRRRVDAERMHARLADLMRIIFATSHRHACIVIDLRWCAISFAGHFLDKAPLYRYFTVRMMAK